MRIQTIKCIKCGSTEAVKNGFANGWQRYKCKKCGYQYTKQNPQGQSIFIKLLASSLFLFGLSKREIAKIIGVTPMSVVRWIQRYHIYYMTSVPPHEKREIMTKEQVKSLVDAAPSNRAMVISNDLPSGGRMDLIIYPK